MIYDVAWLADPLFFGDYPQVMKDRLGDLLPKFTEEQKIALKNSVDFFAVNHYTSRYARNNPSDSTYQGVLLSVFDSQHHLIGPKAGVEWFYSVPWGFRKVLSWISKRYSNPPIIISENGVVTPKEDLVPPQQAINDTFRIHFYKQYINQMELAIFKDGVNVRGYFAWSFMDNFEWTSGFATRFGLVYVDYSNDYKRYVKQSAKWLTNYFRKRPKSTDPLVKARWWSKYLRRRVNTIWDSKP
jgi:beta-glucosidase